MLSKIIDKILSALATMVMSLVATMLAVWIPMLITDLFVSTFDIEISFVIWSVDYAKLCGFWTWLFLWAIIAFVINDESNREIDDDITHEDEMW